CPFPARSPPGSRHELTVDSAGAWSIHGLGSGWCIPARGGPLDTCADRPRLGDGCDPSGRQPALSQNFVQPNSNGIAKVKIVSAPFWNVLVEKSRECGAAPSNGMDAVRNG